MVGAEARRESGAAETIVMIAILIATYGAVFVAEIVGDLQCLSPHGIGGDADRHDLALGVLESSFEEFDSEL